MVFRAVAAFALMAGVAMAQVPVELAAHAAQRFPQAVRVDSLLGRDVLQPIEAQPVLGHVVAVTRRADGGIDFIVRTGGVLGFGGRMVAVPAEAMGLLGEYVAVLDYTPEQLAAFPTIKLAGALPGPEMVRVGLTKPFH